MTLPIALVVLGVICALIGYIVELMDKLSVERSLVNHMSRELDKANRALGSRLLQQSWFGETEWEETQ